MKKIETIWIIDDDPIFIFGLKRKLKQLNFTSNIIISNNGEQALTRLNEILASAGKEKFPDLILLDLNMPKIDGWQFMEEYEKMPCDRNTIIYIITSSIDPEDLKKVTSYDKLNGYYIKPFDTEELRTLLLNAREGKTI